MPTSISNVLSNTYNSSLIIYLNTIVRTYYRDTFNEYTVLIIFIKYLLVNLLLDLFLITWPIGKNYLWENVYYSFLVSEKNNVFFNRRFFAFNFVIGEFSLSQFSVCRYLFSESIKSPYWGTEFPLSKGMGYVCNTYGRATSIICTYPPGKLSENEFDRSKLRKWFVHLTLIVKLLIDFLRG